MRNNFKYFLSKLAAGLFAVNALLFLPGNSAAEPFNVNAEDDAVIYLDSTEQIIRGFGAANILPWRPDMTEDEIETAAFELARECLSPNTELHLNEYNVINSFSATKDYPEIIYLLKERDLIDERGAPRETLEWLETYLASPFRPQQISPVDTSNIPRNPILVWHSSGTAIEYNLQISTSGRFSSFVIDTTVADTLLQLPQLEANRDYFWRVSASNENGTSYFSDIEKFTTGEITGIIENDEQPVEFRLAQNYPNPFIPSTKIKYSISEYGFVSLKVFNLLGEEVVTLYEGMRQAGNYKDTFNGDRLSDGVYLYRLITNSFVEKKLMLLK